MTISRAEYQRNWRKKNPDYARLWYANNPERARSQRAEREASGYMRHWRYGVAKERLAELRDAQGGRCAICAKELNASLHLDHDHVTGRLRGLLCNNCNVGLGHFRDDPLLLKSAISYLTTMKGD